MATKLDGPGIAAVGIGLIFVYGGVKGYSPLKAVGNIITGKNPNEGQDSSNANLVAAALSGGNTITSSGIANSGGGSPSANQQLAKQLAIQMGHSDWTTGQEWSDWVSLWNQESSWQTDAANPTSSARGIAQDINGYGPDNVQGNSASQITWGINYIAGRYGNPSAAWAHEKANNWY